jgi:predicted methyltransferase
MSHRLSIAAAAAVFISLAAPAMAVEDAALKTAVAGSQRSQAHLARDAARHPYETLTFWGLAPNQTVIEISPGSGYWTEILAPYAKATGGTYVAGVADTANPKLSEGARKGRETFEAKYADQAKFGKITYVGFGPVSGPLGAPGSADMVITARNIHNWLWQEGMTEKAFKDFAAVLKPGGVLAVEEHRADPRPQAGDARDGYVATSTVVAIAEKAGLQARWPVGGQRKPQGHQGTIPFGVWTLPPSRNTAPNGKPDDPNFDRSKYDAIGESDRMTLKFVKQ